MTPFFRLLPQRYDREHDPEKGRFLAAPADRAGARPGTRRRIAVRLFAVRPLSKQLPTTSNGASRAGDESAVLANGFVRRHGPRAPSGGDPRDGGEPLLDASRASRGHRLRAWELGEHSPATNRPKMRPTFRAPRRETDVRANRDAFHRPSLVRAREDCSSACSSGPGASCRVGYRRRRSGLGAFETIRAGPDSRRLRGRLPACAGGERSTSTLDGVAPLDGSAGGDRAGTRPSSPSLAAASWTTSTTEHFRG